MFNNTYYNYISLYIIYNKIQLQRAIYAIKL